ncbi:hypothetical protein SSP531S_13420 [Streptomyces spongiicola]|uniref:RHS repeat-associated core domain-containing protein n=1 Tax=Streptomyces spongiicola TaxID=1690221 RepID=A0A388STQ4_9ACTN|nr:RHS repeat-associated core domain-containing protein [Streptomyces spongiicola]GBP99938.1 hypothetical protein SSP531S_13420 [Streptomyces spongiicola]
MAAVTGQAITRRKQLPFGQLRSEQSTAFGTRGFVGGTNDPSGLTHLGAREYDPALGAFISVDPIIDFADPAQMHAYSYAHNTPLTKSDPDGLRPAPVAGTSDVEEFNWARDRGMRVGYTQRNGRYVWGYHPMKDTASQHRYRAYQANVKAYEAAKASRAAAARAKAQAIARAKEARAKADRLGKVIQGIRNGMAVGGGSLSQRLLNTAAEVGFSLGGYSTRGMCFSGSGGIVIGGGGQFCFVAVKTKNGSYRFGHTRSFDGGTEGFKLGGSLNVGVLRSNADDIAQFGGMGHDAGGSLKAGLVVYGNHETAIGTRNSKGQQVSTIEFGSGLGIGMDLYTGFNRTWADWF